METFMTLCIGNGAVLESSSQWYEFSLNAY